MIPHTQTILEGQDGMRGNCWQTAIASILDLPIDSVPHFVQIDDEGGENWWTGTLQWLGKRNLTIYRLHKHPLTDEYYFVSGKTIRGTQHVTVYQNGKMIHDPHPSAAGLISEEYIEIIRP